mmetsp:Transcript_19409/g.38451  ORF Transcript_19409/g.38451 Transcript_19409/m.38451 type:complete len:105 (+) Transcript_19409:344-658(+)
MLNAGELIVLLIKVFHFFVLRTHLTGMHRYFFFVTTILRNFTSLFYFEEHHLSLASVIIDIPLEALYFEEHYLTGVLFYDTSIMILLHSCSSVDFPNYHHYIYY